METRKVILCCAASAAVSALIAVTATAAAIREILVRHGLPVSIGLPASRAMDAIRRDKKNLGGRIQAVLLRRIGEAYLYDTTPAFFEDIVI